MSNAAKNAIEILSLSKTYRKGKAQPVHAVESLSLTVPAGQVLAFLGPNGAGKTTTIKMICGLVTPTTGSVKLDGYDVSRQRGQAMTRIGAVLEGTRNVYWRLSAWENLMYFGRMKGQWGKTLNERAERLLRDLDLWDRRSDQVQVFSRGMQQKVAIACALVADPPIILLDEPTLGLDVQSSRTVKEWVEAQARQYGKTVILTTHQLDMAQEVSDRVAIMNKGRLITDQPVADLLGLFRQEFYEVKVKGHLDATLLNGNRPLWLDGLSVRAENGHTILSGPMPDQARLYTLIGGVRELNLPLISVARTEDNLEEVFVRLTSVQK